MPALINFGNALLEAQELDAARQIYERAIACDANSAQAHQGLSHVLERMGLEEEAERHRQLGFQAMPVVVSAFRGEGMPVSLLLLSSAFRGNVPVEVPLDDNTFMTIKLFTDYYEPDLPLPPHDVIFNSIGDADLCRSSLEGAVRLLEANDASAINPPADVLETGRVEIAQRLRGIEGLIVPRVENVAREDLGRIERFPVLLRPPGYHTGEFFELVRDRDELARIAASLPGETLLAIELLDARGADGHYRKYRVSRSVASCIRCIRSLDALEGSLLLGGSGAYARRNRGRRSVSHGYARRNRRPRDARDRRGGATNRARLLRYRFCARPRRQRAAL